MFILRNVGNFVAPFKADNDYHGSAAVIEYAVSILNVEHIIVCGHSHCGACQALVITSYSIHYTKLYDEAILDGNIDKILEGVLIAQAK